MSAALVCLCLLPCACRESSDPSGLGGSLPLQLKFSPGDTFTFDAWVVDQFGYVVPSTRSRALLRVLNSGGTTGGFTGVATLLDSASVLRDSVAVLDTVTLGYASNGDFYRYGFLARMARLHGKARVPKKWDCIAAFSLSPGKSWQVGSLDSAGMEPVFGRISGAPEMFSVRVNGVQTVYSGYRVDLTGQAFSYVYWVSDAPTSFLRIALEPDDVHTGGEFDLTDIRSRQ